MLSKPFQSIMYADGTDYRPPTIHTSTNGWVYKPDELRKPSEIKRGTNKSWPRDSGYSDGERHIRQSVEAHFTDREWERPIAVDGPMASPSPAGGSSLNVAFKDSVFGWVTLSLTFYQHGTNTRNRTNRGLLDHDEVTVTISGHKILWWLLEREVTQNRYSSNFTQTKPTDLTRFANKWLADPWGVTLETLGDKKAEMLNELLAPPTIPEFAAEEYTKDAKTPGYGDDATIWSNSSDNGLYYKTGVIKQIMESDVNWKALNEVFDALKFTGYKLSLKTSWSYSTNEYKHITGLSIEIPEQNGTHEHTVSIDAAYPSVRIVCGYMEDEERWVETEKRKAIEAMGTLEDALRTFEIDLDEGEE